MVVVQLIDYRKESTMLEAEKVSRNEIDLWRKQIENGDLSDVGEV
ncbi:hypothetical protein SALWKB29_2216 [Snodgrassella communis]|uniref:Uncharacterized protein n=1 Tax=Snodgrassella communis TaxID=2946699 RepID=A0A836Z286_9NEIS|nr:hypothetical protein SALWKB29_2216 [Snodgrassella communis]